MSSAALAGEKLAAHYAGRRVCVTGGAGFIGGHLAGALLDLGASVSIIDDLSASDGAYASSLVNAYPGRARFIYASILEPTALDEAALHADTIFHLAAMTSVPRSIEEPARCFEVNVVGTVRVAEAARAAGARRIVLASSSSVYGDDAAIPKHEALLPRPLSPYAASKTAGEAIVRAWSHVYSLWGVSLRYFNIFGPRQSADNRYAAVIPAFIKRLNAGQRPIIHGDGSSTRDFTPVANAVHATILAGASPDNPGGQAVNIGLGQRTSVLDLAHTLARLTDRPGVEPEFQPARPGDVPHSVADISRASRVLGYQPVKGLEEGLAETVAWFSRQHNEAGAPV